MVEVQGITKTYGNKKAVKGITFSVEKGEILGFLGVNGAGKSTTLNIITGYICPNEGDVIIDGKSVVEEPVKARGGLGYLPEVPPLYLDMTVLAYLKFCCELKKVKSKSKLDHIAEICKRLNILDVKGRLLKNLSKGYRQRVGLAAALLGEPQVIILDEPSVGLDPRQVVEMRDLIKELGKKHTVVLSSHILSEVQEICSRIIIINDGSIVADEPTASIVQKLSCKSQIVLEVEGEEEKVLNILKGVEGVSGVNSSKNIEENIFEYVLQLGDLSDISVRKNIFFALAKGSFPIVDMHSYNTSLENVFLSLTESKPLNKEFCEKEQNPG